MSDRFRCAAAVHRPDSLASQTPGLPNAAGSR